MGILLLTFYHEVFFKVLAYFFFPPPILSSLIASFPPRFPPFLSAVTILSLSLLSFFPFLPPSLPFALTYLALPLPVPSHMLCFTLYILLSIHPVLLDSKHLVPPTFILSWIIAIKMVYHRSSLFNNLMPSL